MHDDMFALMRTHRMKIPAITDEVEVFLSLCDSMSAILVKKIFVCRMGQRWPL